MRELAAAESRTAGPYRLLAELGRGGMGRVLLGASPDGRLVAVKQIRPALAEEDGFVARFRREVAASRKVSGAYTAAVVDAEPDGDAPWLASVFVPGPSLQDAVDVAGVLPAEPALRLAAGLAAALTEIHRAGLVHRDLKPSNVLLAADGARVIDFGIARAVDGESTELTRTGWLIGSPGFMSPEQAEGAAITPASDVFSLGSVLVMACTGSSPFLGPSAPRTLYNVVHGDPVLTGLSPDVARIAALCLAKDPSARPTPTELLSAIGPVTPSATPWPQGVHRLIDRQHTEVAQLLDGTTPTPDDDLRPDATVDLRTTAGPTAATNPEPVAAPGKARRLWALVAVLVVVAAGALVWSQWPSATSADLRGDVFTMAGHTEALNGFAFSPDNTVLASASDDYTVRLWNVESRREIAKFTQPGAIHEVAFNPDGTLLATASHNEVRVWDIAGQRQRGAPISREYPIDDVAFSPDGTMIVTSSNATIEFWDATTREYLGPPITRIEQGAAIAFSRNGNLLATASEKWARLWDARTHAPVGDSLVLGGGRTIEDVAFSPDGATVALGTNKATTILWDVTTYTVAAELPDSGDAAIENVAYGRDNRTIATTGAALQLWQVPDREPLDRPADNTSGLAFSSDGRHVATGKEDGTVLLYRLPRD